MLTIMYYAGNGADDVFTSHAKELKGNNDLLTVSGLDYCCMHVSVATMISQKNS